ncbi:uncharacterized protein CCR75_000108 [Bremia lactucae]|uniref:Uncharacterized protein n=1 Tax=Bremia lactucae TaxID=4779 RepID=A0A976NXZ0_BRELC|nr:hypothetical protein CCR75_000108 [Bremia lactucae]
MTSCNDNERVVYYDLEAGSHTKNLLLSPTTKPAFTLPIVGTLALEVTGQNSEISPHRQHPWFILDETLEKDNEENPFATLLLPQQSLLEAPKPTIDADKGAQSEHSEVCNEVTSESLAKPKYLNIGAARSRHSRLERRETSCDDQKNKSRSTTKISQHCSRMTNAVNNSLKILNSEAASLRPERWTTKKVAYADTIKRRKSLGALQKRLSSQLDTPSEKRRKSMPVGLLRRQKQQTLENGSVISGKLDRNLSQSKKKLLSDVLQRATMISQRQNIFLETSLTSQAQSGEDNTKSDAISDTIKQLQAEPFVLESFSSVKSSSVEAFMDRKTKTVMNEFKTRGNLGDVIRKAIRKRKRDLTLLRSHDQHLLPQQSSQSLHSSNGVMECVQDRAWIKVHLKRRCAAMPHLLLYECQMHDYEVRKLKNAPRAFKEKNMIVKAFFDLRDAGYPKLSDGILLKIYDPLYLVAEQLAAGSTREPTYFLLGTQLAESLNDS